MRSEKWKALVLKTSKLRRVRTSLRLVLRKAVQDELRLLNHLRDLYRKKQLNGTLISSQAKREDFLIKEANDLLQALTTSILRCSIGASCISKKENKLSGDIVTLGEDMVWNPLQTKWICINCYNHYYKTEAKKKKLENLLKQGEKEERIFNEWLSKQIKHD